MINQISNTNFRIYTYFNSDYFHNYKIVLSRVIEYFFESTYIRTTNQTVVYHRHLRNITKDAECCQMWDAGGENLVKLRHIDGDGQANNVGDAGGGDTAGSHV